MNRQQQRGGGGQGQQKRGGGGPPLGVIISKLTLTPTADPGTFNFRVRMELTQPVQQGVAVRVLIQGKRQEVVRVSNFLERNYDFKVDQSVPMEVRAEIHTNPSQGDTVDFSLPGGSGTKTAKTSHKRLTVNIPGLNHAGENTGVIRTYDKDGNPGAGVVDIFCGVQKLRINSQYFATEPASLTTPNSGTLAVSIFVSSDTTAQFIHQESGEVIPVLLLKPRRR